MMKYRRDGVSRVCILKGRLMGCIAIVLYKQAGVIWADSGRITCLI